VVSIDEKSQIPGAGPDRTGPLLPLRPGMPAQQTRDDRRHGTTTLFAALTIATGQVTDRCYDRHTHVEFLDFRQLAAKTHPRVALRVVCDDCATHKHPQIKAWWPETIG
jgi:hypothetical protein